MIMAMMRARIAHWLYPGVKKPCSYTGKACPWSGAYRDAPLMWKRTMLKEDDKNHFTMETQPFLRALLTGVQELESGQLDVVFHFVFFWEYFEETILGEYPTPFDIWRKVRRKCAFTDYQKVRMGLVHFVIENVHAESEILSHALESLKRVDIYAYSMVKRVVQGKRMNTTDSVSALLILAWWFRRDLFVGEKWDETLKSKCLILEHLNELLQNVIEARHGRFKRAAGTSTESLGLK